MGTFTLCLVCLAAYVIFNSLGFFSDPIPIASPISIPTEAIAPTETQTPTRSITPTLTNTPLITQIPTDTPKPEITLIEITAADGCPNGCTYHKPGCDIKGNISINTGEKIYHLPGQEYYEETKISPEYGERWFCTEAEAIANGWRKSKK